MNANAIPSERLPDSLGHFGPYGGRFVPETLIHPLQQLELEYERAAQDPEFLRECRYYLKAFCGRPTPLYFAERLSQTLGGARVYLKREDLLHTGAHKINNCVGHILLDLPPEEGDRYREVLSRSGLRAINLVAPTTPDSPIESIAKCAAGFAYYFSREAGAGMQNTVPANFPLMVGKIRGFSNLPIAVGFGIATPEQARAIAENADAVVIGSAIVSHVSLGGDSTQLVRRVCRFVESLIVAVKSVKPMKQVH